MSRHPSWHWLAIHWPRPLSWQLVFDLMQRLVADPSLGRLIIETRATHSQISFRIGAEEPHVQQLQKICHNLVPGVQISTSKSSRSPVAVAARLKVSHPSLALDSKRVEAISRVVLAGMSGLEKNETLVLQVIIGGRLSPAMTPPGMSRAKHSWWQLLTGGVPEASAVEIAGIRQRQSKHGALVSIHLGASATTPGRSRHLVSQLFGGLRVAEVAGVTLHLQAENPDKLNNAQPPWRYPLRLSASEIACMLAWPIGDGELPGMPPVSPRKIPPPKWLTCEQHDVKRRAFATSSAPGQAVGIGIGAQESLLHTILLGPTGSGKSTAMTHMALADINDGRGVIVIDPKDDLVNSILERLPPQRLNDVVVLDVTSPDPVGLNPLAGNDPELTVDSLLASFKALFADSWGVRTEEILTAALLTLVRHGGPEANLVAVPSLLTDTKFRHRIIKQVDDPLGTGVFWAKYESKSIEQRATEIAPVLNKMQQFVIRPQMRAILGQAQPRFTLDEVFTKRKILLVSLNKGVIGSESARLLGSLLIGQLWPLILSQSRIPPERRRLVSVFVDEVYDFIHAIPGDLSDALAQSRSLGVAWYMAHQYRQQLTPAMRAAIDTNARNKICFGLSADDAHDMAKSSHQLEALDFIRLPRFAAYVNTWIDGKSTGWLSATTKPPAPALQDPIEPRALSATRYGVASSQTEKTLRQLLHVEAQPTHHVNAPSGRIGRRAIPEEQLSKDGDESLDEPTH